MVETGNPYFADDGIDVNSYRGESPEPADLTMVPKMIGNAISGTLKNRSSYLDSRKKVRDLQGQYAALKSPEPTGMTLPQGALGLLLAAFDSSGRTASGYMQGLGQGWDQYNNRQMQRYQNEKNRLLLAIEQERQRYEDAYEDRNGTYDFTSIR